jgi:hypothetical protein
MPATLFKESSANGVNFGITNETGILLSSFSRDVSPKKTEVMDANGDVVAVAFTGNTAKIKLDGTLNGAASFNVGTIYALANSATSYGLTGGTILVDSVSESAASGEFKKISVELTQYEKTMTGGTLVTAPGTPTPLAATAGVKQATITFTAGSPAGTSYTATSNPGGITATAAASPILVSGLTTGTSYTFTVVANNTGGAGTASTPTAAVTPT